MASRIEKIKAIWSDEKLSRLPGVKEDMESQDILSAVLRADPTPTKKYATWILGMWEKKQFKWEDIRGGSASTVGDTLTLFEERKKLLPPDQRSLMKYKTLDALWTSVRSLENDVSNKSLKRLDMRRAKIESWEHTFENGLHIIVPLSEFASRIHGRNTRWCTAANYDNAFRNYARAGVLVIFRLPDGTKFQGYIDKNSQVEFLNEGDARPTEEEVTKMAPYHEDILQTFENLDMGEWGKASPDIRILVEEKMTPGDSFAENPFFPEAEEEKDAAIDINTVSTNPDVVKVEKVGKITKLTFSGKTPDDVFDLVRTLRKCIPEIHTNAIKSLQNVVIDIPTDDIPLILENIRVGVMPKYNIGTGMATKIIKSMIERTPEFYKKIHATGFLFVDGDINRGFDTFNLREINTILPGYVGFLKKEGIDVPLDTIRDINSTMSKLLMAEGIGSRNISEMFFIKDSDGNYLNSFDMHDVYVSISTFCMRNAVTPSVIELVKDISNSEGVVDCDLMTPEEVHFTKFIKSMSRLSLSDKGDEFIALAPELHPDAIVKMAGDSNSPNFKVECGQFVERILHDINKTQLSEGLSVFKKLLLIDTEDEEVGMRGFETTDDFDDELLATYHALPLEPEEKIRLITRSVLSEQAVLTNEAVIDALENLPLKSTVEDYRNIAGCIKKSNQETYHIMEPCLEKMNYTNSTSAEAFFENLSRDIFYTPLSNEISSSLDMEP